MTNALKESNKAFKQVCNDLAIARIELEQRREEAWRLSEDLRRMAEELRQARAESAKWERRASSGGDWYSDTHETLSDKIFDDNCKAEAVSRAYHAPMPSSGIFKTEDGITVGVKGYDLTMGQAEYLIRLAFTAIDDLGSGFTFRERAQVAWEDIVNEVYEVEAECYFTFEDDGHWQYPRVNFYFIDEAGGERLQSKIVTLQNIYDLGVLSLVAMPAAK